jgi:hypothetical protein
MLRSRRALVVFQIHSLVVVHGLPVGVRGGAANFLVSPSATGGTAPPRKPENLAPPPPPMISAQHGYDAPMSTLRRKTEYQEITLSTHYRHDYLFFIV